MVPLVIVSIALMSRGDRVTGVNYRYASAARLGIAWAAQLAAPSSCGVATATRLYGCSPRALDSCLRLPRASFSTRRPGTGPVWQALPSLPGRSTYARRRGPTSREPSLIELSCCSMRALG